MDFSVFGFLHDFNCAAGISDDLGGGHGATVLQVGFFEVEAAVEFEGVEREVDGDAAVEDGFVAFALPDGFESVVLDEVLEERAIADVFVGFAGGEVGLRWQGDFAHERGALK